MRPRKPHSSQRLDPNEPHAFVATLSEGLAQASSGSAFMSTTSANSLAVTMRSVPATRCLLAGCGRDREDPIHDLPE